MARTSRWLVGSSSMSTSQSPMSSRARSTRRRWPPERVPTCRVPIHILEQPRDDGANPRVAGPFVFGTVRPRRPAPRCPRRARSSLWPSMPTDTPRVRMTRPSSTSTSPREHSQKRGLPIAVLAHDADAGPLVHPEGQSLEHRLRGEFHPHLFTTEKKRHEGRLSHWRPRPTSGLPAPFVYHISRLHQAARHASQVNSIRHRL